MIVNHGEISGAVIFSILRLIFSGPLALFVLRFCRMFLTFKKMTFMLVSQLSTSGKSSTDGILLYVSRVL